MVKAERHPISDGQNQINLRGLDFSPATWFHYRETEKNGDVVQIVDVEQAKETARSLFKERGLYTEQVEAAMQLSEEAHRDKIRKVSGDPYFVHPLMTAVAVAHVTHDSEVVAGALCHDIVEDSPKDESGEKIYTLDVIANRIAGGNKENKAVRLVDALTSDATYDKESIDPESKEGLRLWQNQKAAAVKKAIKDSPEAVLVKTADFLSNISDFISDYNNIGESAFNPFKRNSTDFVERFTNGIVQMYLGSKNKHWEINPLMNLTISKQLEFINSCRDGSLSSLFDSWEEEVIDIYNEINYADTA